MLVTCSIGRTSHQSLILYTVARLDTRWRDIEDGNGLPINVSFYTDKEPLPDPTPPRRDPSPPPNQMSETAPTHDHGSNSVIGEILKFKGKRKEAKAFIQNCKIYFRLNPKRIAADDDGTKIFLALNKISDGAKEWKDAQIDDLLKPDSKINWTAFKTAFLENWGEVDPAGNTFTQLLKLQQ